MLVEFLRSSLKYEDNCKEVGNVQEFLKYNSGNSKRSILKKIISWSGNIAK